MANKYLRSLIKFILPLFFKILLNLKLNRRVINFLSDKSYSSNDLYNFTSLIKKYLKDKKIIALDVGAQGGFNSDCFFPSKYNNFFEEILIEPIGTEAEKIKNKIVINKGLWSKKEIKSLFILGKRIGSSSMYQPDRSFFDLHDIKNKDYEKYDVTRTIEVECDTLSSLLNEKNIKNLDYLKIDTQGAEFEILKGIGKYRPLLIKIEVHLFSMYKNVPGWHNLINLLYELNYSLIDLKGIGSHSTRIPVEADMIFIPNFNNNEGKKILSKNIDKFISLMLIFGQIKLLKVILNKLNINLKEINELEDNYFN